MLEFTDLLDEYLDLREHIQVQRGSMWERLQELKTELNDMVRKEEN